MSSPTLMSDPPTLLNTPPSLLRQHTTKRLFLRASLVYSRMASPSPSSTPPALTPDYTGSVSPDSSGHAESAVKKARRQTAFYPNMNSVNKPVKPFSRSAAKRQSVMTLGSIEHLQHYFTKTGIAAKPKCVCFFLVNFLLI